MKDYGIPILIINMNIVVETIGKDLSTSDKLAFLLLLGGLQQYQHNDNSLIIMYNKNAKRPLHRREPFDNFQKF